MIQKFIQDYFTFTKKERIAVVSLMAMLIVIFSLPHFIPQTQPDLSLKEVEALTSAVQPERTTSFTPASDSLNSAYDPRETSVAGHKSPANQKFRFDPNTLGIEGWLRLGVRERTATTIRKYLSKGGQFRQPEDLRKIYGMSSELVNELIPFIKIRNKERSDQFRNRESASSPGARAFNNNKSQIGNYRDVQPGYLRTNKDFASQENHRYFNLNSSPHRRTIATIDISVADSVAFECLPGIGPKLAARIISFRDKLGGFYSVDQVAETFGLPDSAFKQLRHYLIVSSGKIKKLSLNESAVEILKSHPYIRWGLANAIVSYRIEHGAFKDIEELRHIALVNAEVFGRIVPYLEL